jgi:hypothetical protein
MLRKLAMLGLAAALGLAAPAARSQTQTAEDPKEGALSWQKKASDTRATVMGVAEELDRIGDQGNAAARGMIDDAKHWVAEGDKTTTKADEEFGKGAYQQAKNEYTMAWQHYVRAATSGLNARRMLTGQ